jgi:hypothetical protein
MDGRRLERWTRQDDRDQSEDDGARWLHSLIELRLPEQEQWQNNGAAPYRCLAERNGVLLIRDTVKRFYVVDINTEASMQEVTDSFRGMRYIGTIVPFEVDLPAFFLSKLNLGSEEQQPVLF